MRHPAASAFPQRIAIAEANHDGVSVVFFAGGKRVSETDAAPEMLLYTLEVAESSLQTWQERGVLLASSERVLQLLAPESLPHRMNSPDAIANCYFAASASYEADPQTLQLALQALPTTATVEKSLLRISVALATAETLGRHGQPPLGAQEANAAGPLQAHAWRSMDAAELLDRCFEHLRSWRLRSGMHALEARPGQREMAHAVLEAFIRGETLVVEAGTGIGKTLAYALPAVLYAAQHQKRVVISTHTRNLQQQLVEHDLPELWDCLGLGGLQLREGERGLRYSKLLGRSNYYCRSALRRWIAADIDAGGSRLAAQLALATLRSPDGVLEDFLPDLEANVWRQICSRREACVGRSCRSEPGCPVHAARESARRAHLVVVNHALLLADARSEGNILGQWDALVVDESHTLKRVATEAFGLRLGAGQVEALAAPVARLESEVRALAERAESDEFSLWLQRCDSLKATLVTLRRRLLHWLQRLDENLPSAARVPARQRYRDGDEVFGSVRAEFEALRLDLQRATREAGSWLESFPEEAAVLPGGSEFLEVLELVVELHFETSVSLDFLVQGDDEDWAFYLDFSAPRQALHEIVAVPLDVAQELRSALQNNTCATVYTSATLCVGEDASYFRRAIGLDTQARLLRFESPFDYEQQCFITQTANLGHYSDPDHVARVAEIVVELQQRTGKRILVLLTAHRTLRHLHEELEAQLGDGRALFAQGISGTRNQLARRFAGAPGAILLGTDSFWEGVDFPGQALEILVITKLPFAVPNEPVVAARSERLRAHGEDPFSDFLLPEAVLRFRQGFGRLIRSQRDRGAVILLDARLETREYGESFLEVLPTRAQRFETAMQLVDAVSEWMN